MTTSLIITSRLEENVLEIVLNRPEKRNALNRALLKQFCEVLEKANQDKSVRTLLIRGNGPVFCAGMDLNEALEEDREHRSAALIGRMLTLLYHSPHVTVAAVHGAAVAGGAGIVAACDIAVAAKGTRIGFPETRKGLVPAQVLVLLMRQLRERDVRALVLLGEMIDAEQAMAMGLINRIVSEEEELLSAALAYCRQVALCAPLATAKTKKLIDSLSPTEFDDQIALMIEQHQHMRTSEEAKEGTRSFLENRSPSWNV